ncbi:MAG: IS1634 family transposase [Planctomycetaceae bacterium]
MSHEPIRRVHIETVTRVYKGRVYRSVLLRRSFREDGRVRHETVGNLSDLPDDLIEVMKRRLASDQPLAGHGEAIRIVRSLPHGNVAAVLGTVRNIGLDRIVSSTPSRERDLVLAMIVDRVISPGSKLSCSVGLNEATAQNTLAEELRLGDIDVQDLYAAMDWLLTRQTRIENKLVKQHLADGTLLLFDVSSSYYTGRKSSLIQYGYSRDHRRDRPQIVYGLLCDRDGRPISVEVFSGNTADPATFTDLVRRVRKRFGLQRVVFVGDRGMITSARINADLRGVEGLDWISALRSDAIKRLVQAGHVDRSLFDETDLAEITAEDEFPGERLVLCRNPLLADERARKREELLRATEKKLDVIVRATQREHNPLRGEQAVSLRVGKVIGQYKMAKHFELSITDDGFSHTRREDNIAAEAALDGLYVVRTSVPAQHLSPEHVVSAYKSLSQVERAFRSIKTVDLQLRPIYHHNDDRIRAHVFLCMLAYYVEWHMREKLAELLFDDTDREAAQSARQSVVAPAMRSESARRKDATRLNDSGHPVQSFQDLLQDLSTLCRTRLRLESCEAEYQQLTESSPTQRRALDLLGVTA